MFDDGACKLWYQRTRCRIARSGYRAVILLSCCGRLPWQVLIALAIVDVETCGTAVMLTTRVIPMLLWRSDVL